MNGVLITCNFSPHYSCERSKRKGAIGVSSSRCLCSQQNLQHPRDHTLPDMLKRQDSSLSSSRRQASPTPPPSESRHATAIGCMSGIFQLFSKYQNSNKRLTFGRRQGKRKPSSPTKGKCASAEEDKSTDKEKLDRMEINCDAEPPRRYTDPPEIRRPHAARSTEDSRTSSSLLMRLIGLEDLGTAAAKRPASQEDSVTDKRKQLLQALEKCNEDLEALKRIINAVQKADNRLQSPHPAVQTTRRLSGDENAVSLEVLPCVEKCMDALAEDANVPVDTTEELTRSPIRRFCPLQNDTEGETPLTPQHHKPTITKFLDKYYSSEPSLLLIQRRQATVLSPPPPRSGSRAMAESVEEVCRDITWGEEREVGVIGLVVQDHLWRELIQEFVHELVKKPNCSMHHRRQYSLPLEPCKRRLCF